MIDNEPTGGPWEIEVYDDGLGRYIVGPDGETIAIMSKGIMADEIVAANARLIRASPDLYEAFRSLLDNLRTRKGTPEEGRLSIYDITKLKAALEKVEAP